MDTQLFTTLTEADLRRLIREELLAIVQHLAPPPAAVPVVEPDYLGLVEAAHYLKISKQTLYGYTSKRLVPFFKMGKKLHFKKVELDAYLESGRYKTKTEIEAQALAELVKPTPQKRNR